MEQTTYLNRCYEMEEITYFINKKKPVDQGFPISANYPI